MPFSAPVLTYRAKALASNMCSKVLNGHIILTDTSITTILAPEMTYTPKNGFNIDFQQIFTEICPTIPRGRCFLQNIFYLCRVVPGRQDIFDESVSLLSLDRNLVNFKENKVNDDTHHLYRHTRCIPYAIQVWGIVYLFSGLPEPLSR